VANGLRRLVGSGASGGSDLAGSRGNPHAEKFRVATALLTGIAIGALALALVILAGGRGGSSDAQWSSWSPSDNGRLGETEIADHVAPYYRITASQQLDVVTLMNIANASAAASAGGGTGTTSGLQVAVNQTGTPGSLSLLNGSTVAYEICGVGGSKCQLPGSPSTNRVLLLRREALELALYTFRYISGIDNVIVLLPPGHTVTASPLQPKPPTLTSGPSNSQPTTVACLFVKQELQPWLTQPLTAALQPFPPPVAELPLWSRTEEAGLVDEITGHGLFSEKIEQAQDGSSLLVLNQLPTQ
jgi:hypothetical protein